MKSLLSNIWAWFKAHKSFIVEHGSSLLHLVLICLAFVSPIYLILTCILGLVLMDSAVAIAMAIKNHQAIQSAKMRATIIKIGVYFTSIVAGFLCEVSFLGREAAPNVICRAIALMVATTELKSILEHLSSFLSSSTKINFWNVVLAAIQGKVATIPGAAEVIKQVTDQPAPPKQ